jgi:diaminohydroxyphosphoribosylaminopyrimidine deaminase/5-amino-6-(5-phosphoribosylamino)uracil reductase
VSDVHEKFMRRALVLARKGVGKTAPNPAVGCVIVRGREIVGEGWHKMAGTPHAEVHALAMAGKKAAGADVYVTLEPCSHHGRTPPCAEALIGANVARVFAGMVDPNPKVSGGGVRMLENAGIPVTVGILERECRLLNEAFVKHITTGHPFVILKSALTLDGKIATATGDSKWITNEKSRIYVHKLRAMVDAVLVGVGTVAADDPQLTARIPGGKDPLRVVVDSGLTFPRQAQMLRNPSSVATLIATISRDGAAIRELTSLGADILPCRERSGRVDLNDLLMQLGARGVQSLLLEGGGVLAGEALRQGFIDKFLLFFAPKLVGGEGIAPFAGPGVARMADAFQLRDINVTRFDDDILVEGYPERVCSPV